MIRLAIVAPCYNEELVLRHTTEQLLSMLDRLMAAGTVSANSCIYFVDDGSNDNTWSHIQTLAKENEHVAGLKLTRNCGHQNALLAGLFAVPGDAIVSIDADLQDDVSAIEAMLAAHAQGDEIVYGVRSDRTTDSIFKRQSAQLFYKGMALAGVKLVYNHADYRLLSRRAIDTLREYREINLFLRGIVPSLGLKSSIVYYKRAERFAGTSKYPLRRMMAFSWEGVTSFSVAPLTMVTAIGAIIFALTILMSLVVVGTRLLTDRAVPGWASTVLPVYLLGGIQILCIGVLGEYMGKIYKEIKARPRFAIETKCAPERFDE